MFKIAICDDENYFRNDLKEMIAGYMMDKGYVFHIDTFSSGKEFISLGIEMIQYTIVFLDINMNEIDGITAAKSIREVSRDVFIVFVTAYIDYTLEGYKVDAVRYLLKGNVNFQNMVYECIDAITEKMNYIVVKKQFKFNEVEKEISISMDRLLYIESKLHKLEFHVMENSMKIYTMYGTLNEIEKELMENDFIRIHQSFLVNLKYIKDVLRYKTVLSNGIELIIPKARYKQVKNTFIAYQGEI